MDTGNAKCPYCGQPITRAIRARIRAMEQKRLNTLAVKAREQAEGSHRREIEAERQSLKRYHDHEVLKLKGEFTRERAANQRKLKELERQLEKKTADELGDGAELDLVQALNEAFREDAVQRVPKGEAGADVIHEVRYRGEACGIILWDSKNRRDWRGEFIAKLKDDKARIGAAHAVLASTAFPRGEQELCIEDGVIVVHPKRVVAIAGLLRGSMVALHRQGLSLQERGTKMAALYRYMSSGDFRQRLREAGELVDKHRQLDAEERDRLEKIWKARERLNMQIKASIDDIETQVTAIMERTVDGEAGVIAIAAG